MHVLLIDASQDLCLVLFFVARKGN